MQNLPTPFPITYPQFSLTYKQFFGNPQSLNRLFTIQITAALKAKTPVHTTYTQFYFQTHLKKRTSLLRAFSINIIPNPKPYSQPELQQVSFAVDLRFAYRQYF